MHDHSASGLIRENYFKKILLVENIIIPLQSEILNYAKS